MMRTLSLFLIFNLFMTGQARAAVTCADVFSDVFTAEKIESTIQDLAKFRMSLDLTQAYGKVSVNHTALMARYNSKEKDFLLFLESRSLMTQKELKEKIRLEIMKLQSSTAQNRLKAKQEKEDLLKKENSKVRRFAVLENAKTEFYEIKPGKFVLDPIRSTTEVNMPEPYEMASIPTTQIVWKMVLERYIKKFRKTTHLQSNPSFFEGERRPVEMNAYFDVKTWISFLNQLSQMGDPLLAKIFPGHRDGDIYRLPTDNEWMFVARGRGIYKGSFHFGSSNQLDLYGWPQGIAGGQTHPVAEKLPLTFEGLKFYDMYANVREWVEDPLQSATHAKFSDMTDTLQQTVRGGSFDKPPMFLGVETSAVAKAHIRSQQIGFRLVREVRP